MYLRRGLSYVIFCTFCVIVLFVIVQKYFEVIKLTPTAPVFLWHVNITEIDRRNLLNLKSFQYVIKTNCHASLLIWIVTSYAADVGARSALRRAYPNSELQEFGIQRIFLLALLRDEMQSENHISQSAILHESKRHNDIIQGNFFEAYKNLTYKHVMGLKWATDHLIDVIKTVSVSDDLLMGYVLKNMKPIREPMNKWFVTYDEFPSNSYPDFLSGWLYITIPKTARTLVNAAQIYPTYFWIDDLFLTGIVRQELDIKLYDMHEIFTTNHEYLNCCLKDKEKKFQCDFAIGPNGGDTELQVKFQNFAKYCTTNCFPRPEHFSVNNTCIVAWHDPSLGRGQAQIVAIQ
ncbi:beta-1,3-galactosyltransferase 5 [Athalia rosae]|uniref:beta-1,3-galactosyltransferase 5 n=1 Tax=Athalia rosae TaxID=37344 RepID=UPI0020337342|nr:beta-1,3-galactosyltransferase 5 [Athalia rosae]